MVIVAALAGIVSVLTSWIAGGRLLLLSRRTRQLPELLIGGTLFLAGGLWNPLVSIGRQAVALPDDVRAALVAIGALAGVTGMAMLAVFNWRVFRPRERWAKRLALAIGLALVAAFAAQSVTHGWIDFARTERGPWLYGSWLGVAIYAWSDFEAWRQYRMLVRRRRLGLADPVVTDRMRLWALTMSAAVVGASTLAACQALGVPVGGTLVGLTITAVISLAVSGLLWLAFLPPAAYVARVRAAVGGT
jgi:hypothetical protein